MSGKQYGLILPNKNQQIIRNLGVRKLNPLVNSDDELEKDEEDSSSLNWVEESLKKSAGNSGQKAIQKRMLREALEEDASVFQYDEVYDDMKETQNKKKEEKKSHFQKPKYIDTILKHTQKRQLENERRRERKVQKEREAEGDEFKDKESFVTPSYLNKLEELKKAELEEKAEQILEERDDVTKHKNFGRFYNHLYKQRLGEEPTVPKIKEEPKDTETSTLTTTENSQTEENNPRTSSLFNQRQSHSKQYRTRDHSVDEEYQNAPPLRIKTEKSTSESDGEDVSSYKKRKEKRSNRSVSHRSRSRSRETRHERGSRSKDKRISRSRSKSRDRKRRSHRSRSNERLRRKSTDSKERCDKRRSRSRNRNERRRSKSKDRSNKYRNREEDGHDDKRKKSVSKAENESSKDKSKRKGEESIPTKEQSKREKQNINKTLGVTDVNKMKIEDRISRFQEIFVKRTTNDLFEAAVQKYFARKAERESNGLM